MRRGILGSGGVPAYWALSARRSGVPTGVVPCDPTWSWTPSESAVGSAKPRRGGERMGTGWEGEVIIQRGGEERGVIQRRGPVQRPCGGRPASWSAHVSTIVAKPSAPSALIAQLGSATPVGAGRAQEEDGPPFATAGLYATASLLGMSPACNWPTNGLLLAYMNRFARYQSLLDTVYSHTYQALAISYLSVAAPRYGYGGIFTVF